MSDHQMSPSTFQLNVDARNRHSEHIHHVTINLLMCVKGIILSSVTAPCKHIHTQQKVLLALIMTSIVKITKALPQFICGRSKEAK